MLSLVRLVGIFNRTSIPLRFRHHSTYPREPEFDMSSLRAHASKLFKSRAEKEKKRLNVDRTQLHILGRSHGASTPSLIVTTGPHSYLFNCPGGFQRICYANKLRLLDVQNVFCTNNEWISISGTPGLALTLQDAGSQKLTIHGSDNLDGFLKSILRYTTFSTGMTVETRSFREGPVEEYGIKVTSIPIFDSNETSLNEFDSDTNFKRPRTSPSLVAYECLTYDIPGRLDGGKCRDLGLPIGPLLAKLKNGEDVTLPDGRNIKADSVTGPPTLGLYFIVVDCSKTNQIESVINNPTLINLKDKRLPSSGREINLVVHFTPKDVASDPRYQKWINEFADDCKHLFMPYEDQGALRLADVYRFNHLLNKVDNVIFPKLHLTSINKKKIEQELENKVALKRGDQPQYTKLYPYENLAKISDAKDLQHIMLRPHREVEEYDENYYIDSAYTTALQQSQSPVIEKTLQDLNESMKDEPSPKEHEPELIFLGTGSAIPNKKRNTSGILVNFNIPKLASVILDCGEDTLGQMVRYYGIEKANNILRQLKLIYVSHPHMDHHIGLLDILEARSRLTKDTVCLIVPPWVDDILNYYNKNYTDISNSYKLYHTVDFIANSQESKDAPASGKELQSDLIKELNGLLIDIRMVFVDHCFHSCATKLTFNIGRPGMDTFSLAYSGDARPSAAFTDIGHGCDLLIHEATFDDRNIENALSKRHSTTKEAIEMGRKMAAKFTILTHFSQKFAKIPYFTNDFDSKVGVAFDFMTVRCPSQFAHIPLMRTALEQLFPEVRNNIDREYNKKAITAKTIKQIISKAAC